MPHTATPMPECESPPATPTRSVKDEVQRLQDELQVKLEQMEQIENHVRQPSGIERLFPFFRTRAD